MGRLSVLFLCVVVPPTLRRDVDHYTAIINSPVQMSCEADGLPPPVVTWYQDGVKLAGNSTWSAESASRVLANGALRIDRVAVNDSGLYECRATNDAGSASRIVTLRVQGSERLLN